MNEALLSHPAEVLSHPTMSKADKRAVLASWASDAHAVADAPTLRQLDSGAVVAVDDILQALRSLDVVADSASRPRPEVAWRSPLARRRGRLAARGWGKAVWRTRRGNDDDPPSPCPAVIALPVRPTFTAAYGERPGR